ncbi:MAG: hypothetical protein HRF49_01030 [bacterium]|jgi:hypothetical protein
MKDKPKSAGDNPSGGKPPRDDSARKKKAAAPSPKPAPEAENASGRGRPPKKPPSAAASPPDAHASGPHAPARRFVAHDLLRLMDGAAAPSDLLDALQNTSSAVWVLWMHLQVIPPERPELRSLICHIWDGVTSNTELGRMMGVHRHTILKWRRELAKYCENLPTGD